jgi:hypothetical protein
MRCGGKTKKYQQLSGIASLSGKGAGISLAAFYLRR